MGGCIWEPIYVSFYMKLSYGSFCMYIKKLVQRSSYRETRIQKLVQRGSHREALIERLMQRGSYRALLQRGCHKEIHRGSHSETLIERLIWKGSYIEALMEKLLCINVILFIHRDQHPSTQSETQLQFSHGALPPLPPGSMLRCLRRGPARVQKKSSRDTETINFPNVGDDTAKQTNAQADPF